MTSFVPAGLDRIHISRRAFLAGAVGLAALGAGRGEGRTCAVARGAHGQLLYVDFGSEIIIARFGFARRSPSYLLDPIVIPTIDAIVRVLTER